MVDPPRYPLAPPYGSRPIVVGLTVLALAGLGAIAWLAFEHGEPASTPAVDAVTAPGVATMKAAEPTPSAVARAVERDPTLVDVCGLGWVEPPADASVPDPAVFAQVPGVQASAEAILARLRDSDDAFERALAFESPALWASNEPGDSAWVEPFAQQAVTSDNPRLYALAFRFCTRVPQQGTCALLSAAQWARIDGGNAAPWLFVLDEAARRDDRALADEALYRIGSAARYDDSPLAAAAPILARAGSAPSDLVAAQALAIGWAGIAAALPAPLQRLTGACAPAALVDTNRRQLCDAAAATLGERSDSALIASFGAAIGRRVGWPLDRLVAIRVATLALAELWSSDPRVDPGRAASFSCDGVRAMIDRLGEVGRVGELQAARAWMDASGKPYEAYAQVAREQEARRSALDAEDALRRTAALAPGASAPVER